MSVKQKRHYYLDFPQIDSGTDGSMGVVSVAEGAPFPVKQLLYQYRLSKGVYRGGHAHRTLEEVIICLQGNVIVTLVDDAGEQRATLSTPRKGLYIAPMVWLDMEITKDDTICLVLRSEHYDEKDYIRDFSKFQRALYDHSV